MKIGPRTYTEQEATSIEVYKSHIQKLQNEIDEHWQQLIEQLNIPEKRPSVARDYLWDYIMNDFT